jgi:hypothetical protein
MVDLDVVKERVKRGALVGAGAFASGFVGERLTSADGFGLSEVEGSLGKIGLGVGVSVAGSELDVVQDPTVDEVMEYVGYGMQGDGFSDLAENIETGALGGSSSRKLVEVNRTANADTGDMTSAQEDEDFLVDAS